MSTTPERKRSIFGLLGDLPGLLMNLVRDEIEQLKQEMIDKAKHAGVGIGLIGAGVVFLFFGVGVMVTAGIIALALVLPLWASALIVLGVLLLIAAILILLGMRQLKKGTPPSPTQTIESVQKDVRVIKGTERRSLT